MANKDSEFYKIMIANGAKEELIDKLWAAKIDDIEMVKEIETAEDMAKTAEICELSFPEKLNLKAVIKKISNKQSIADPEELDAVNQMSKKLDAMKASIDLIAETTKKIENESGAHSKKIKETFDNIITSLKARQNELIDKVHKIATEKKLKLAKIANELQTQCIAVKTKIESSQKMIKEQIDVTNAATNIKVRKEKILKMAKEVSNIKVVNKTDSVITNNAINVVLNEKKILEFVSNFGDVSSSSLPILISLKDNGQNGVIIQWKATGTKPAKTEPNKIKFEWMQTQTNDDEKEQWQQKEVQKDVQIDEMNQETVDVDFDAEIGFFAFRLRIFDQLKNEWSLPSNAMSVQMKNNCKMPQGLDSRLIQEHKLKRLMMENVLPQTLKNKKFELLLRGSEHGLTNEGFNERCKDKGSLLVIIQSKEYSRTFGGYTKIGIKSGNVGYEKDEDAFLFYIDPKTNKAQRFKVKTPQTAVYCLNSHSVIFGCGHDLYFHGNGKGSCARSAFDYSSG